MNKSLTVPLDGLAEELMKQNELLDDNVMGDLFGIGYNTPYGEIFTVDVYDEPYFYMLVDNPEILKLSGWEIIDKAHKEFRRVCGEWIKKQEEEE